MTANMQHILVPTDGSKGSLKAATFAGDLARALGARISVLLVQADDLVVASAWGVGAPGAPPQGVMSVEEVRDLLEQRAREKELPDTVNALGDLAQEPAIHTVWGHAADEICRFAKDNEVELIVLGSHGRTGISRMLLGSVSHAVVNQAACPVTIVR